MMAHVLARITTTLLVLLALVLSAWFVISAMTGATLITFRTGSMAPTMPQGALAITVPVAAKDLQPGDVVTVPRGTDPLPVTHRVVGIEKPPSAHGSKQADRALTLKGDANKTFDAQPYVVSNVHKVVVSFPQLGSALMVLQSPIGLGTFTLLVAALMFWAFWPRTDTEDTENRVPRHAVVAHDSGAGR